jgi:E3 ubiquitin-protein ligase MARCH6
MPVAVKYFRPSDGLHAMYSWWFRKCARLLRLTWFLLDERMNDEEGYFVQWSLKDTWVRMQNKDLIGNELAPEDQFVRNGRYVRTPASDMVRIPKDGRVFLEVNEHNERVDNNPDREEGLHGKNSKLFKMVYAPPWFRVRIFAFIVLLWLFAAVTGCSITLIPLVFGRWVFGALLPEEVKKNDIYAFSMGIIILGGIVYCLLHLRARIVDLRESLTPNAETPRKVMRTATAIFIRVLRLIYAYSAFVFVLPTLFAFLVEFYLIVPLHTYFVPDDQHTIQFVQTWTLGVLFFNLARRCILWYGDTRPAEALRAVVRKGMLDPDIRLATRCFIFPMVFCSVLALVLPLQCAWVANYFQIFGTEPVTQTLVYRYSYPAAMVAFLQLSWLSLLVDLIEGWRMSIRDEVYLIGERLHNFGDSRRKNAAAAIPNMGRIKT